MTNNEPTKQIAATLHQVVSTHQFTGQEAEMVIGLKDWLAAIAQGRLIVTPAQQPPAPKAETK